MEFARFENMKKMEARGQIDDEKMQPGQQKDDDSFKVRKGQVGGFKQYLTEADLKFIEQTINQIGCPFVTQYYQD